jgi:hypothetical protein
VSDPRPDRQPRRFLSRSEVPKAQASPCGNRECENPDRD